MRAAPRPFTSRTPTATIWRSSSFPRARATQNGTVPGDELFLGIDHTAVGDTDSSLAFYRDALGLEVAGDGEITLKGGRVEQGNFDTYQLLRINEAPVIEVHIVQSSEPPGGMGEPGTSAIAPAITNATFAATGKRVRKLPVDTTALKQAL
jgi:isoquinoline 1-oxidoreductase subunit beta